MGDLGQTADNTGEATVSYENLKPVQTAQVALEPKMLWNELDSGANQLQ